MKYITTNIRLPEDLWKALKMEAAEQGKRFAEVVRERLLTSSRFRKKEKKRKPKSLCGILRGIEIPDSLIEEAKQSLFPPPEKFRDL